MSKEQYKNTKVITLSDNGSLTAHETEDEALEWIADKLEANPRIKHIMFKPYQKVEPKRPNLKDLITKVMG